MTRARRIPCRIPRRARADTSAARARRALAVAASLALAVPVLAEPVPAGAEALYGQRSTGATPEMVRILGIDGVAGSLEHPVGYQGTILDGPGRTVPAGGAAYLSAAVDHLRDGAERSVLLGTGDNLGGTSPESALLADAPMLEALRHMGLAASAVGESDLVSAATSSMGEHGFPYVASNLAPGTNAPITPFPYLVLDVGGLRIGVVAATDHSEDLLPSRPLVGPKADPITPWAPEKKPLESSFRAATDALDALDVHTIVGLVHIDSVHRENDPNACPPQLAELDELRSISSSVDALLVGDSGGPATCDLTDPDNMRRPVLAPASHGRSVAVIDLMVDPVSGRTMREQTSTYNQRVTHDIAPDPEVEAIIDGAKKQSATVDSESYGEATETIPEAIGPGGESPLADLVADAEWESTRPLGADLAIYNPDSLRVDLEKGPQTYRTLDAAIPYGDRVNLAEVSGRRLLDAFSAYIDDVGTRGIAVSRNVALDIDPRRPVGEKLVGASIGGTPVDPAGQYTVAAGEFLLSSEWGDAPLTTLTKEPRWSGLYDVQTLAEYFRSHGRVDPPVTGERLRDVSAGGSS